MNKKGFTLIEVLAVMIVIIIVLVISVPIVTSVINGTTRSAFSSDARMILNSLRIQKDANPDFDLTTVNQSNLLSYQIDDDNYESLTISIEENEPYIYIIGQGKWNGLKACGTYKEMNIYNIGEEGVCLGEEVTSGDPIVVFQNDPNPGIICGEGLVEDYVNNDICYIYSVADLVAFSHSVNNGNNYLGKTVELVNDIDIEDNSTYGDINVTGFGDINGNDNETETLDIELTTGEGFIPIGHNTINFQGTFEGNARTISNLYINRPTRQYTGLFGYNNGNIYGLNLVGINIEGNSYIGGLTGYNNGDISDIYLQGDIVANNSYAGGVVGYNNTAKKALSLLADVNLEAYTYAYIGGIVGRNLGTSSGIVKDGYINTTNYDSGRGYGYTSSTTAVNIYFSDSVDGDARDIGNMYNSSLNDNLNGYDAALDTWIGGDNDSNGYYFDYNSLGEIVIKSVEDYPMPESLPIGEGTIESPYLIRNYDEWKTAALFPHTGEVFSLETDIDFSGSNYYYAMGSNQNYFSGTFNGNGHILSNITTTSLLYSGIFGYNNGNIYGLSVKGLTLSGMGYTGGITGYNNGNIIDIYLQGDITVYGYRSGGIVGFNASGKKAISLLTDININELVPDTINFTNLGGIVGRNEGIVSGFIVNGIVKSTDYYSGRGYGHTSSPSSTKIYFSDAVTGSKELGIKYDSSLNNNLNGYDIALDTWIGGDNDSNGHYFDYNSLGEIVIKSVKDYPMDFNLSGTGTEANPYLINNYADWKTATLKVNENVFFSLKSDIDFSGNNYYYAMGSGYYNTEIDNNYFNGTFEGNGYTLSKIITTNMLYGGLFGYNNGNIYGFNVNELTLNGMAHTGGITGYNNGTIKDIALQGNMNTYGIRVGGVVGENAAGKNVTNVLTNINLEGNNFGNIGGTVGRNSGVVTGVVEAGTINTSDYYSGNGYGYNYSGGTANVYFSSGVIGTVKNRGTEFDESNYNNLTSYATYGLETVNTGDIDGNGYYFDYNSDSSDIIVVKVP